MADENRDDIVTKPDQDTPTPVDTPTPNKSDGATTPTTDQQNTNTKPDNEAPSGNPLDPRNSALGDSVWLGMDDAELEAEAARRLEADEEEAPDFKNSLSGLDGKDTPANKGANTSVLDRLNAANNKPKEEVDAKPKEEADAKPKEEVKGANTAVLDRLNDSQNKAKAEVKDEFNIDDILAAAKSNTAKINELKSQAPAGPSETAGRNQNQSQSNKQDAKPTSENEADAKPDDDDEEEYEYDADGNRIVRGARINTGLGGGSTKSNATPKSKPANQTQAKNTSANQKSSAATPAATAPKQSTSTAQNNPATPTPPKPSTPTPQGQNNNQPTTQPQNASNKPGAPSQGGNAPAGGGGGGGGSVPLKQNIGALVSNTVGLAKNTVGLASNTVGVAASAVGSIPAFANAIKTNTGNAANKLTGNAPGNTSATANTATANTATGKTPRAPIPTSNIPNVKTGAPFTNHAANQSSYSMNGLRPANTSKPTNNLAPGQRLNLKHPLPPHQNLTPIKNNVIPISAAQNKAAPITPAAAVAIASNSTAKPTSKAAGGQLLQNIAQKSKQKKQGLFANLPADNAMHNLPPTTKQALEDAHSARNSINDNLGSIEKDNPIGTLRDQKEKGLNDGFRNYADSSEAANELLKNNSKKPADREASLEATKYLDKMNKDVSKNTDTAKGKKLLDKDNDTNMQDKMKGIVESTKKIMDSIKATIESVAKLFSRNKPKP